MKPTVITRRIRQDSVLGSKRIIGGNCHKYHFCGDKPHVCRDKYILSRQAYFCQGKHVFVATKYVFCRDKLSRQKYFIATNIILSRQKCCRGKQTFVATNTCLSRHKWHLWQLTPMIQANLTLVWQTREESELGTTGTWCILGKNNNNKK